MTKEASIAIAENDSCRHQFQVTKMTMIATRSFVTGGDGRCYMANCCEVN